jgi:hypothetical protein
MVLGPERLFGLIVLGMAIGLAQAQTRIYTCTTSTGKVITSDRPIAECLDRPQRELRPDGTVRRVIQPQLVGEDRLKAEEEKKQREQEEQARLEQVRRDKAILGAYQTEADLEAARRRSVRLPEDIIQASEQRLAEYQATHDQLLAKAGSKGVSALTAREQRQLEDLAESIAAEKALVLRQTEELKRINARFDADLQRFRELTGGKSQPSRRP